jgi:hypothetical protein
LILAVFATEDSNLTLSGKKLRIDAPKPFPILQECLAGIPATKPTFEPENYRMNKGEQGVLAPCRPRIRGRRYDVRTYGRTGLRLLQALRQWLRETSPGELLGLGQRLRALFDHMKASRSAIASNHGNRSTRVA